MFENGNLKYTIFLLSIILSLVVYVFLSTIQRIDAKDVSQDTGFQNQQAQISKTTETLTLMNALLQSIDGRTSRIEKKLNLQ